MLSYLAPLGKLADWAVYCDCVNFFIFLNLLVISWRPIISGSTGPIFTIFSPMKGSCVNGPVFSIPQGRCNDNQFWAKLAK